MALADDIKDDVENIFYAGEFDIAAVYTAAGMPGQNIMVSQDHLSVDMHRDYRARVCEFGVLAADVADPREGDTIQVGTEIWTVRVDGERYQPHGDGFIWHVWATKSEARRY